MLYNYDFAQTEAGGDFGGLFYIVCEFDLDGGWLVSVGADLF